MKYLCNSVLIFCLPSILLGCSKGKTNVSAPASDGAKENETSDGNKATPPASEKAEKPLQGGEAFSEIVQTADWSGRRAWKKKIIIRKDGPTGTENRTINTDAQGRIISISHVNNVFDDKTDINLDYDPAGRIVKRKTDVKSFISGSYSDSILFAYDGSGRFAGLTVEHSVNGSISTIEIKNEFDEKNRIIRSFKEDKSDESNKSTTAFDWDRALITEISNGIERKQVYSTLFGTTCSSPEFFDYGFCVPGIPRGIGIVERLEPLPSAASTTGSCTVDKAGKKAVCKASTTQENRITETSERTVAFVFARGSEGSGAIIELPLEQKMTRNLPDGTVFNSSQSLEYNSVWMPLKSTLRQELGGVVTEVVETSSYVGGGLDAVSVKTEESVIRSDGKVTKSEKETQIEY